MIEHIIYDIITNRVKVVNIKRYLEYLRDLLLSYFRNGFSSFLIFIDYGLI